MKVPVRNLYYLLSYAWDSLPSLEAAHVGRLATDRPEDLFAKVLIEGTRYSICRGLDRDYVTYGDELRGIRGKLDVSSSVKRLLFPQGKAACEFDEFSFDIPNNRILKATMARLSFTASVNKELRRDLRDLTRRLSKVSDVSLSAELFGQARLHRNNAHYGPMLQACELVYRNLLWDQATRGWKFNDFRGDERQMGALFERFVRNFLCREQSRFQVSRTQVRWSLDNASKDSEWLPRMETDISLRDAQQTIVLETKYYTSPMQQSHGTMKIRSDHLYQIFAYLKNLESEGRPDADAAGVLLYAAVDRRLDFRYDIHGHEIRVKSLDLDQSWQGIHSELLGVIEEVAGGGVLAA